MFQNVPRSIFKVFPFFLLFPEPWRLWNHSQIVDLIFLIWMVSTRASESSKARHSWQNNVPKRSKTMGQNSKGGWVGGPRWWPFDFAVRARYHRSGCKIIGWVGGAQPPFDRLQNNWLFRPSLIVSAVGEQLGIANLTVVGKGINRLYIIFMKFNPKVIPK